MQPLNLSAKDSVHFSEDAGVVVKIDIVYRIQSRHYKQSPNDKSLCDIQYYTHVIMTCRVSYSSSTIKVKIV